jgi:predicted Zn-dependent protease
MMKPYFLYLSISVLLLVACKRHYGDHPVVDQAEASTVDSARIERYLHELVEGEPQNVRNHLALYDYKMQAGKRREARKWLDLAMEMDPQHMAVLMRKADWLMAENEPGKAIEILQQAGAEMMRHADAAAMLARAYYASGNCEQALDFVHRRMQSEASEWNMHFIKGQCLLQSYDTVQAMEALKNAFLLYPADTTFTPYFELSLAQKNDQEAEWALQQYSETQRSHRLTMRAAQFYKNIGRTDTAMHLLKKQMKSGEGGAMAYHELAGIFYAANRYDSAIFYANEALQRRPGMLQSWMLLGRAYDRRYRFQDAADAYAQVLQRDSTYAEAAQELELLNRKIRYAREQRRIENQREAIEIMEPLDSKKSLNVP